MTAPGPDPVPCRLDRAGGAVRCGRCGYKLGDILPWAEGAALVLPAGWGLDPAGVWRLTAHAKGRYELARRHASANAGTPPALAAAVRRRLADGSVFSNRRPWFSIPAAAGVNGQGWLVARPPAVAECPRCRAPNRVDGDALTTPSVTTLRVVD